MKKIFEKIWDLALPYQDKRDDNGHAEITLHYALKLLESEKADEDVVIPAIIMHDIGWNQLSRAERMIIFDQNATDDAKLQLRFRHQDAGVRLARDIMDQIDYPSKLIDEILEIISQHDTRKGFISRNEGIVRDADKLWRFSRTGFAADITRGGISFQQLYDIIIKKIELPDFFFSDKAKQLAYEELKMRKAEHNGKI